MATNKVNQVIRNKNSKTDEPGARAKTLGSKGDLYAAVQMSENYNDILQIIFADILLEFCNEHSFSKEEFESFKLCGEKFFIFLEDCKAEKIAYDNLEISQKKILSSKK